MRSASHRAAGLRLAGTDPGITPRRPRNSLAGWLLGRTGNNGHVTKNPRQEDQGWGPGRHDPEQESLKCAHDSPLPTATRMLANESGFRYGKVLIADWKGIVSALLHKSL